MFSTHYLSFNIGSPDASTPTDESLCAKRQQSQSPPAVASFSRKHE